MRDARRAQREADHPRQLSGVGQRDAALDRYLFKASRELLSREDEVALAREIRTLRTRLWATVLDIDPPRSLTPEPCPAVGPLWELLRRTPSAAPIRAPLVALEAAWSSPRSGRTDRVRRASVELARVLGDAGIDPAMLVHLRGENADVSAALDAYNRVRQRFVAANLRLVAMVASRIGGMTPLADRLQMGTFGLIIAVDRFDPDRGLRFSTYSVWWIRHYITRGLTDLSRLVRVPAHAVTTFFKGQRVERTMILEGVREPTLAQVAAKCGVKEHELAWARKAMQAQPISLDTPVHTARGEDGPLLVDTFVDEDEEHPDERLDRDRKVAILHQLLDGLGDYEREILERRFGLNGREPETLQEIGEDHGLSRERIRQLEQRVLEKLRAHIKRADRPGLLPPV